MEPGGRLLHLRTCEPPRAQPDPQALQRDPGRVQTVQIRRVQPGDPCAVVDCRYRSTPLPGASGRPRAAGCDRPRTCGPVPPAAAPHPRAGHPQGSAAAGGRGSRRLYAGMRHDRPRHTGKPLRKAGSVHRSHPRLPFRAWPSSCLELTPGPRMWIHISLLASAGLHQVIRSTGNHG